MRCYGEANLHEMKQGDTGAPPESLRFYIDGDPQLVFPLYEIIFNHASAWNSAERGSTQQKLENADNIQLKLPIRNFDRRRGD